MSTSISEHARQEEISLKAEDAARMEVGCNANWIPGRERPRPYGYFVQQAINSATAAKERGIEALQAHVRELEQQLQESNEDFHQLAAHHHATRRRKP